MMAAHQDCPAMIAAYQSWRLATDRLQMATCLDDDERELAAKERSAFDDLMRAPVLSIRDLATKLAVIEEDANDGDLSDRRVNVRSWHLTRLAANAMALWVRA